MLLLYLLCDGRKKSRRLGLVPVQELALSQDKGEEWRSLRGHRVSTAKRGMEDSVWGRDCVVMIIGNRGDSDRGEWMKKKGKWEM